MKNLLIIFATMAVAVGCSSFAALTSSSKTSQGAPYEILVVANAPEWEGEVGEAIKGIFNAPLPIIVPEEPRFSILRVTANDFKNLLTQHRNILKILVSPSVEKAAVLAQEDVEATPQIVLTFQAPSKEEMLKYITENGESIVRTFEIAERNRVIAYGKKFNEPSIEQVVKSRIGIDMNVPKGYTLRSQKDYFVWISYEYPAASQGFFIYSYPFTGIKNLTAENIIKQRDKVAQFIPGPAEGSYMTTVKQVPNAESDGYVPFEPEFASFVVGDRNWVRTTGLWEVEGDYMGGVFESFSTIDNNQHRVIVIDTYVYSPKYGKRNYLRALEALPYLVK